MLRKKKQKKPLKHSICIANSLVSFFGDETSGGCFAFCQFFFSSALNFCFPLSGDDLQFRIGRWKWSRSIFPLGVIRKEERFPNMGVSSKCFLSVVHLVGKIIRIKLEVSPNLKGRVSAAVSRGG